MDRRAGFEPIRRAARRRRARLQKVAFSGWAGRAADARPGDGRAFETQVLDTLEKAKATARRAAARSARATQILENDRLRLGPDPVAAICRKRPRTLPTGTSRGPPCAEWNKARKAYWLRFARPRANRKPHVEIGKTPSATFVGIRQITRIIPADKMLRIFNEMLELARLADILDCYHSCGMAAYLKGKGSSL